MSSYIHIPETSSTNTYLSEINRLKEVEEGTVVYTDFQTAGKGQRGNTWEAEKCKNILFSIILRPNTIRADKQFIISQFVSLAIKDVLESYTGNISIKWPNDIYWKEKKICGILIENVLSGDKIQQSISGIGININQTHFSNNLSNPISLRQITGKEYDTTDILDKIINRILLYYKEIMTGQRENIISSYKSSLFRHKGYHLYDDGKNIFKARIKDIEDSGLLVLETENHIINKFAFKEIKYIL